MSALSVCIIACNEERDLPRCLASVAFADDVVVVIDARSADRSEALAQEAGARVLVHPYMGNVEQKNHALALARWLEGRKGVRAVLYPGLESHPQRALVQKQMRAGGSLVTFSLDGGKAAAFRFLNALRLIVISNNLGDSKSLATHPATTTHQRLSPEARAGQGIDDGMVRISVGLEDVADIEEDLARALAAV